MTTSRLAVILALAVTGCATPRAARAPAAPPERFTMVEGTAGRLRVSDGGAGGPAVVFLHGLGSDLEAWRAQLDHVRASRRAVAYDQRGHGGSEKARDGAYTIAALAADLEAVRTALGLGRVVLVGHSMSGTVLTTYAAAHPEAVAGLLYVDAVGDFHAIPREDVRQHLDQISSFGAAQRRASFEAMLGQARPGTRAAVLASLDRIDPPAYASLYRSMAELTDARQRLSAYRGPAHAIEVAGDPMPFMASAALDLPRGTVPGVSHWLQLDAPDAVCRELDAFLARVAAK